MTYIYAHFFSNGDKYVGISNNPEQRWKEGFDSNNTRQYNHKVLIANEKHDRLSLVISEDLPRRIAETMEAILINNFDAFNLNIKDEIMPNLHGNDVICIWYENFAHVYPKIDGEELYHSPEIEEINSYSLAVGKKLTKREIEEIEEKIKKEMEERRKKREKEMEERRKKREKEMEERKKEKKRIERGGVDLEKILKERGGVDLGKILKEGRY